MKTTKLTRVQFNNKLRAEVAAELTDVYSVDLQEVVKNNNLKFYGLCIRESKDSNIAPIFYINDCYKDYYFGRLFSDIVRELVTVITDYLSSNNEKTLGDVSSYGTYDGVKDKIVIKLINYANNKDTLKSTPHIRFLDLAITFGILVSVEKDGVALAIIKDDLFKMWNVTVDDLYRVAMYNTRHLLGYTVSNLSDIFNQQFGIDTEELGIHEQDSKLMIVISNKTGLYGASVLLYKDLLKSVSDKLKGDLVIFPSSIHEVIATRYTQDMDTSELIDMVKSINTDVVEKDEVLSNNVYVYERINNTLSQVCRQ